MTTPEPQSTQGPVADAPTAAVLAALAEPHRTQILRLLEQRHRSQKGLARELGLSQSLTSHHLRVLKDAGLIDSTICGRSTVYLLNPVTLRMLSQRLQIMAERAVALAEIKPC